MSYAPRGRGGGRGGSSGGRGGFRPQNSFNQGPPDSVLELGTFLHPCEGDMVCTRSATQSKIPYFNAPVYTKAKVQIGKVDEIFGNLNQMLFTVKLTEGLIATSFKPMDAVYIGGDKLLPLDRFLTKPVAPGGKPAKALGKQTVGSRGGARGGRGGARGGARGGFAARYVQFLIASTFFEIYHELLWICF